MERLIYLAVYLGGGIWIGKEGFPGESVVKNPPADTGNTGDLGSLPGSERSPGIGLANHSSILA